MGTSTLLWKHPFETAGKQFYIDLWRTAEKTAHHCQPQRLNPNCILLLGKLSSACGHLYRDPTVSGICRRCWINSLQEWLRRNTCLLLKQTQPEIPTWVQSKGHRLAFCRTGKGTVKIVFDRHRFFPKQTRGLNLHHSETSSVLFLFRKNETTETGARRSTRGPRPKTGAASCPVRKPEPRPTEPSQLSLVRG